MQERYSTFSSSQMHKLMVTEKGGKGFGVKATTYIKQIIYQRRLGRPVNPEREARPTSWGEFLEKRAFDLLPTSYQLVSKERIYHPEIPFWSGMPDVNEAEVVGDIKCPYSLEVFCKKIELLEKVNEDLGAYKKEFPEDFWQHTSNAILTNNEYAEAIIYCPYLSELEEIREMVSNFDGNQNKYAWIHFAEDKSLPYLNDGGYYKNLNVFRFKVPEADKELLTQRVIEAGKYLE